MRAIGLASLAVLLLPLISIAFPTGAHNLIPTALGAHCMWKPLHDLACTHDDNKKDLTGPVEAVQIVTIPKENNMKVAMSQKFRDFLKCHRPGSVSIADHFMCTLFGDPHPPPPPPPPPFPPTAAAPVAKRDTITVTTNNQNKYLPQAFAKFLECHPPSGGGRFTLISHFFCILKHNPLEGVPADAQPIAERDAALDSHNESNKTDEQSLLVQRRNKDCIPFPSTVSDPFWCTDAKEVVSMDHSVTDEVVSDTAETLVARKNVSPPEILEPSAKPDSAIDAHMQSGNDVGSLNKSPREWLTGCSWFFFPLFCFGKSKTVSMDPSANDKIPADMADILSGKKNASSIPAPETAQPIAKRDAAVDGPKESNKVDEQSIVVQREIFKDCLPPLPFLPRVCLGKPKETVPPYETLSYDDKLLPVVAVAPESTPETTSAGIAI